MNKITMIASVLLLTVTQALAQKEFKLSKSGGKLVLNNISNLKVEGYEGKEIIFSATGTKEKTDDPRAVGLSALGNFGFDNTGIGISITEKDNITFVAAIEKELSLAVKLPQNVALSIKTAGLTQGDSTVITLSNIKTEIDASTQYEHISIKNVTGPVSIKTLRGNIEGKLTPSFKGPISLVSVYGFIDVTVPENTKADMAINTMYETLYAAKDLKLVVEEKQSNENRYLNAISVRGKPATVSVSDSSSPQVFVKDIKTKGINEVIVNGEPAPIISTHPTTVEGKHLKAKSTASSIVSGKLTETLMPTNTISGTGFTFDFPISSSFSSRGTIINGKLNGGGDKISLKSTYGKIYLRK
ncbi:hypothetical protein [Pedobacter sp.]